MASSHSSLVISAMGRRLRFSAARRSPRRSNPPEATGALASADGGFCSASAPSAVPRLDEREPRRAGTDSVSGGSGAPAETFRLSTVLASRRMIVSSTAVAAASSSSRLRLPDTGARWGEAQSRDAGTEVGRGSEQGRGYRGGGRLRAETRVQRWEGGSEQGRGYRGGRGGSEQGRG